MRPDSIFILACLFNVAKIVFRLKSTTCLSSPVSSYSYLLLTGPEIFQIRLLFSKKFLFFPIQTSQDSLQRLKHKPIHYLCRYKKMSFYKNMESQFSYYVFYVCLTIWLLARRSQRLKQPRDFIVHRFTLHNLKFSRN